MFIRILICFAFFSCSQYAVYDATSSAITDPTAIPGRGNALALIGLDSNQNVTQVATGFALMGNSSRLVFTAAHAIVSNKFSNDNFSTDENLDVILFKPNGLEDNERSFLRKSQLRPFTSESYAETNMANHFFTDVAALEGAPDLSYANSVTSTDYSASLITVNPLNVADEPPELFDTLVVAGAMNNNQLNLVTDHLGTKSFRFATVEKPFVVHAVTPNSFHNFSHVTFKPEEGEIRYNKNVFTGEDVPYLGFIQGGDSGGPVYSNDGTTIYGVSSGVLTLPLWAFHKESDLDIENKKLLLSFFKYFYVDLKMSYLADYLKSEGLAEVTVQGDDIVVNTTLDPQTAKQTALFISHFTRVDTKGLASCQKINMQVNGVTTSLYGAETCNESMGGGMLQNFIKLAGFVTDFAP